MTSDVVIIFQILVLQSQVSKVSFRFISYLLYVLRCNKLGEFSTFKNVRDKEKHVSNFSFLLKNFSELFVSITCARTGKFMSKHF